MLMNKKIVTVTLNPCVDLTVTVEKFLYGETNTVLGTKRDFSGKGINTSIVLNNYGLKNISAGFAFSKDYTQLQAFLNKENIEPRLLKIPGELRTNVKIFDASNKVMSEFNDKGTRVEECCQKLFLEEMDSIFDITDILILSGSVPPGISRNIYRTLAEKAGERGVKVIVDACGELLTEAIEAKPFLIKPNQSELKLTLHMPTETVEEIVEAANMVIRKGVNYVCVSRGDKGAVLISKESVYLADAVQVEVKGIQGAGDSMIAGICYAIKCGLPESEYLRYAVAAATGSLLHEGTELCDKSELLKLINEVRITRIKNGGDII